MQVLYFARLCDRCGAVEERAMSWHEHIRSDPEILAGKPAIRGTRLSVAFLLGPMAEGWSEREILENYPQLSPEDMHALFGFASECVRDGRAYAIGGASGCETRRGAAS